MRNKVPWTSIRLQDKFHGFQSDLTDVLDLVPSYFELSHFELNHSPTQIPVIFIDLTEAFLAHKQIKIIDTYYLKKNETT